MRIGIFLVVCAGAIAAVIPWHVSAQEAIFVIRHGAPPKLMSIDHIGDDMPLSETGLQRARVLANHLKDAGINVIYATEAVRTVQMAEPLAKLLNLPIQQMPRKDIEGLVKRLRSQHSRDRVFVVGHWNTVPQILKALGHPQEVKLERTAYDEIFLVFPNLNKPPVVVHLRY